jgi:hypothetical protein
MQSAYQFCRGTAVVVWCLVGACHVAANDTTSNGDARAGATSEGGAERGGSAAEGGKHAGGSGGSSAAGQPDAGSGEAGQAGAGNEAGDAASGAAGSGDAGSSNAAANAATSECDVDGGCASTCTGETVSCGVEPFDNFCEFNLFLDTPVTVTCGQTAIAGIADCGGCGKVAVEVFYDGSRCWEGIPDCPLPGFSGELVSPHAPLP